MLSSRPQDQAQQLFDENKKQKRKKESFKKTMATDPFHERDIDFCKTRKAWD